MSLEGSCNGEMKGCELFLALIFFQIFFVVFEIPLREVKFSVNS